MPLARRSTSRQLAVLAWRYLYVHSRRSNGTAWRPMRMTALNLTFSVWCIFASVLHAACASHRGTTDGHDALVFREVLASIASMRQSSTVLVESATDPYRPWLQWKASAEDDSTVPEDLARAYIAANRQPGRVPDESLPANFQMIEPPDVRRYFENGPREGWGVLEATYGARTGIVSVSRPAYSYRRDTALITYSFDYGPLGGETNYVMLRRVNGTWKIVATSPLALS